MTKFRAPPPEVVAEARAVAERQLSAEEFASYVNAPWSEEDRAETRALIDWFCRRYRTPFARLAAARRSFERARRMAPTK